MLGFSIGSCLNKYFCERGKFENNWRGSTRNVQKRDSRTAEVKGLVRWLRKGLPAQSGFLPPIPELPLPPNHMPESLSPGPERLPPFCQTSERKLDKTQDRARTFVACSSKPLFRAMLAVVDEANIHPETGLCCACNGKSIFGPQRAHGGVQRAAGFPSRPSLGGLLFLLHHSVSPHPPEPGSEGGTR